MAPPEENLLPCLLAMAELNGCASMQAIRKKMGRIESEDGSATGIDAKGMTQLGWIADHPHGEKDGVFPKFVITDQGWNRIGRHNREIAENRRIFFQLACTFLSALAAIGSAVCAWISYYKY